MYSVSADVEGTKIVQQNGVRSNKAIVGMLATAREPLKKDIQLVASMLQSAMAGVSRRLLEFGASEKEFGILQQELIFLMDAYLKAGGHPSTER